MRIDINKLSSFNRSFIRGSIFVLPAIIPLKTGTAYEVDSLCFSLLCTVYCSSLLNTVQFMTSGYILCVYVSAFARVHLRIYDIMLGD